MEMPPEVLEVLLYGVCGTLGGWANYARVYSSNPGVVKSKSAMIRVLFCAPVGISAGVLVPQYFDWLDGTSWKIGLAVAFGVGWVAPFFMAGIPNALRLGVRGAIEKYLKDMK